MLRAVLISLLFIVSLIFVFQNQLIFLDEYTIYLDFFFYKIGEKTVPNSILIASSFILGFLVCIISIGIGTIKKVLKLESCKKIISLESSTSDKVEKIDQ
ncbi:hypothetical protein CM15mP43_01800 [bacterium]|nr:MAG: hypothetical protein CM15mP43_01800 [bacterium]